ncbi:hypothetical protein [Streptomyces hokutonensis]|uniref:hypothetical protein n=1 Tax=Streptomyces hokutonensis TaxID=1306990 RepID=UPI000378E0D6|nr:hypothetical protein [Streptomyces hokutonensis]
MIATELLYRVSAMAVGQLIQTRYGAPGALALILIGVGVKARSASCASVGAVILVLLMTQA